MTLRLFADPVPPRVEGIDLRCCDVAEVLAEVRGARLIHADPPWLYEFSGTDARVRSCHYDCLPIDQIVEHLSESHKAAADGAYLVLWVTWPILAEWTDVHRRLPWKFKSGGAWGKSGAPGVGFHWRGDSEPVLLYVKGNPRPADRGVSNLHVSAREAHSEKPAPFLRRMLAAFTSPNDLVLDLYAGLAPMARACALDGRKYVGAEIDPVRHAKALGLLNLALQRGE